MADVQRPPAPSNDTWFRGHVLTRFFATVWWVVMVLISLVFAISLVNLAREPEWSRLISAAISGLIFIPVGREWPNWRRMGRMLAHGT